MSARFPLGQVVITKAASLLLQPEDALTLLRRHQSGDWGDVCAEDARANEDALERGGRILSAYEVGGEGFYVVTEHDRSSTCVMRKGDY